MLEVSSPGDDIAALKKLEKSAPSPTKKFRSNLLLEAIVSPPPHTTLSYSDR